MSVKALKKALAHQQSGRIQDAKRLYLSVLQGDPRNSAANHGLGLLAVQQGKVEAALPFLTAALQSDPREPAHWHSFAEALLILGRTADARAVLEKAISSGLAGPALAALKSRLEHRELHQQAHLHHNAGRLPEAEQIYRRILAEDPDHADSLHMLGVLACQARHADVGVELISRAIGIKGDVAQFHANLGRALSATGRNEDAIISIERALELDPDAADAHSSLAIILQGCGQIDAALARYEKVLQLDPDHVAAHNNIGATLLERGKPREAGLHFTAALRGAMHDPDTHNNLASALRSTGELDRAVFHYREALRLNARHIDALSNLAGALKEQGKIAEAIDTYKAAIDTNPNFIAAHSNLLMLLGYSADIPHNVLVAQAKAFDARVAAPLLRSRRLSNPPDENRRLRVGYVSGDFREHAVGYFLEPLLAHHDRDRFEIFAYATMHAEDTVTERMKASVDHWRNIRTLSDDAAADLIEQDGVDILVDLSGHMAGNRLLVFARKPAPVQATWLGFTTTTGVKAIDYRITDNYTDPVGMTEHFNTEKLWRLPGAFCCYQATTRDMTAIDHPPRDDNGYVTFGCFNNFTKVSDGLLRRWAEILAKVPDARLLLEIIGIDGEDFRRETEARLDRLGLPLDRVILEPRKRTNQFVLYNKIDIALDPFPFNGGTTTMDALWMGVPVVTLAGEYFTSRMGVTILTNTGLPELIATTESDYVEIAVGLATNPDRLRDTRHDLRKRVTESRMMNHAAFARDMEDAFRGMWRLWCEQHATSAVA